MPKFRLPRLDWIELLLVGAAVSLFFQLFPSVWWSLVGWLDPRDWSRSTWFVLNLLVLLTLFGIKLAPGLYEDFQRQRAEKIAKGPRKSHVVESLRDSNSTASLGETRLRDDDYQARLRRDAEWRERAKKRHPWR